MTAALALTEYGDFDIVVDENGAIVEGDELVTACTISLFTRRADPAANGPNGWWGDAFSDEPLGSRLHLLEREKLTQQTLRLAELYSREALQWLIDDRVFASVTVTVARNGLKGVDIGLLGVRPNGSRWERVWKEVRLGGT